jgi:AcrR family transcriptional regulator
MPRTPARVEVDAPEDEAARRTQILEAANRCFAQLGIARTSLQDVARVANLSRGTVYRYFDDRGTLIDAAIEFGAQAYYRDAAAMMAKVHTLAEQVGAMAEVVARLQIEHRTRNRLMSDDAELMRNVVTGSESALARTCEFLHPFVEAAQKRGEVRSDVDAYAASEWLARILISLTTMQQSVSFDMSKPKSVRRFVEGFATAGLGGLK